MKKKQQQILVLTLGSILAIGFLWLMVTMGDEDSNVSDNVEQIFDSKTGEASYINFSVPFKNDSLVIDESLTEHYERSIRDSLNKLNIDKISLSSGQTEKIAGFTVETDSELTPNSRLDFSEVESIVKEVDLYENSNDWLKPKTSSSSINKSNSVTENVVKEKKLTTKEEIYIARRKQRDERLLREQELKNRTASSSIISEGIKKVNIIVKATIDFDQTITNNGSVRMRLLEDLVLNDGTIPEDTSVWGTCTFNSNGRVTIYVNAINYNDKLHYVHLDAFDFRDGQKGLIVGANNVREALEKEAESKLTRETSKAGRVLNSVTRVFKKRDVKVQLFDEHHIYLKN